MRKAISLVLGFTLFSGAFAPLANATSNFCFTTSVSNYGSGDFIQIIDARTCEGALVIPETIDSLPVREIVGWSFDGSFVTSIELPSTITSLGYGAFYNIPTLQSFYVDSDNETFTAVSGVLYTKNVDELISYPASKIDENFNVPNSVQTISDEAFFHVNFLKNLVLNEGLSTIREYGLELATSLRTITIPSTLTQELSNVLIGLTNLEAINVTPGNDVFYSTNGILFEERDVNDIALVHYPAHKMGSSYSVPSGTWALSDNSFRSNRYLETITFPNTLESIGRSAFEGALCLSSVIFPQSVTWISDSAFRGASKLGSVTFQEPASIQSLQMYTFSETALNTFRVPSSVSSINPDSFLRASKMTEFSVEGSNSNFVIRSGAIFPTDMSEILAYPFARVGSFVIPSGPTMIYSTTFQGATGLTSVSIPASVTIIEEEAFADTSSLVGVIFAPDSNLETIRAGAFNQSGLLNIAIPASVKTIGPDVFAYNKLQSFSIASGNTRFSTDSKALFNFSQTAIVAYATQTADDFYNVPSSVTLIGRSTFQNATNLKTINIGIGVETIFEGAFIGTTVLESIDVDSDNPNFRSENGILYSKGYEAKRLIAYPSARAGTSLIVDGADTIDCGAFFGSKYLQSIDLSSRVNNFCEGSAFDNAFALKSITLSSDNSLYSTLDGVLFDKSRTKLIKFPEGKTGTYVIPASVTTIAPRSFAFTNGITQLLIPSSVVGVSHLAFLGAKSIVKIEFAPATHMQFLGYRTFADSNIETVSFAGKAPAFYGNDVFGLVKDTFKVLYDADETGWNDALKDFQYEGVQVYSDKAIILSYKPTSALTSKARVTGVAKVGKTVTVAKGAWNSQLPITYKYQWFRCGTKSGVATVGTKTPAKCTTIAGATKASFKVTSKQKGAFLRARIVGTNGINSSTVFSSSTVKVG